jgi:protein-tyrosine-phosphatase
MAEAFLNRLAKGKAQALSAGTQPATAVNPLVIEVIREVGIDISRNRPKALTFEMVEQTDRVITMGCGVESVCPAGFVETEDWNLEDPADKTLEQVRQIRDEIKKRVMKLLEEAAPAEAA